MDEEAQPEPTVDLFVRTSALVSAIGQLAIHYPLVFHADAWRALTAELAQREIAYGADRPIVLARQHYDSLPFDVKVALRGTKA
jgi:extradiol dioxygenase family protein